MMQHSNDQSTAAELVASVRAGDRSAFEPLLAPVYPSVLRLCQRLLGPTLEAEDIAQEAALQAYLGLATLDAPDRFSAWLHAIAANLARMALRRRRRMIAALDAQMTTMIFSDDRPGRPEELYLARETHDLVVAALNELSAVNREVVIGFYLAGYSYADLAELLGVPVSAVRGRLFHGRNYLRRLLQPVAPHSPTNEPAATRARMLDAPWRRRFQGAWPPTPPMPPHRPHQWRWHFEDTDGDELGRWYVTPTSGGHQRLAAPELPLAYASGIAIASTFAVVGSATADTGFCIHRVQPDYPAQLLYQDAHRADVMALSRDETLVCVQYAPQDDWYHPALRVLDLQGRCVAELWDGPGWGLWAGAWSPIAGDQRLLVRHERANVRRPAVWTPTTGALHQLAVDLPGEVDAAWYPDASALLLRHEHCGRASLYRFDLTHEALVQIETPVGDIWAFGVQPHGTVWYGWNSAAQAGEVRVGDRVYSRPAGTPLPVGAPATDFEVDGIHGFLLEPPGPRPHPTVVRVNSHPWTHFTDSYTPVAQTWVDHGFAVAIVNGRGSDGYGKAWRDAPIGNVGFTELADITAVRAWLLAQGIADPGRVILFGEGWGGYLTLLGLGTQPDGWNLGIAEKPVADLATCYADVMEPVKAWMRAQLGGAPKTVPEVYRRSSPLTYVDQIRAPVLVIGGAQDARCPIRQIEQYVDRLRGRDHPHEFYRYHGGFMLWDTAERVRQAALQLRFATRHLGTQPPT